MVLAPGIGNSQLSFESPYSSHKLSIQFAPQYSVNPVRIVQVNEFVVATSFLGILMTVLSPSYGIINIKK